MLKRFNYIRTVAKAFAVIDRKMFGVLTLLLYSGILLVPVIRAQGCDSEPDPTDGRRFRSVSTGQFRQCRSDFVFELSADGCGSCGILKIGYAMAEPCKADVEITFANHKVSDVSQFTWLQTRKVGILNNVYGSTNGPVGVFDGVTSSIRIPLFEYSELGARLEIKLRYRESPDLTDTHPDMAILSNNDRNGMFPTLAIIHSVQQNAILAALNTTGGKFVQFYVPLSETMRYEWKTVKFEFNAMAPDGVRAKLSLEGGDALSSTNSVVGNIQSLQAPLVVGKGSFFANFKGQLDYVRISRCSPVVGSSIN